MTPSPIIIYTRFTLLHQTTRKNWKASRASPDDAEYFAKMLDPERIDMRAAIFFDYSLPLLEQAVNENPDLAIQLLVHTTDRLPASIRQQFDEASARLPWLKTQYIAYDDPFDANADFCTMLAAHAVQHKVEHEILVPMMRLDDDDMMAPAYFPMLKRFMDPRYAGFTFHTPRGFEALYDGKKFIAFSPMNAPRTGIGLAHLARFSPASGKFISPHLLPPGRHVDTDKHAPLILDGSQPVILRSKHMFNSARDIPKTDRRYLADVAAVKRTYFREAADLELLQQYFPIFAGRL